MLLVIRAERRAEDTEKATGAHLLRIQVNKINCIQELEL
jgi:hypothetical protein